MKKLILIAIFASMAGIAYAQYVSTVLQQRIVNDQNQISTDYQIINDTRQRINELKQDINSIVNDSSADAITASVPAIQTIDAAQANIALPVGINTSSPAQQVNGS